MPEHDQQQDVKSNRRGFLAQATEFTAALPLAALAVSNWNRQDEYNTLDLEDARLAERPINQNDPIERSFHSQAAFHNAASSLSSSYRADYHKSRVIMVPQSNGKTVTLHPQTQYYWDVPDGIPGHGTVSNWQSAAQQSRERSDSLTTTNLVDANRLKEVAIETRNGDERSRQILTGLVYGSSIGLLWGYEELLALASSRMNGNSYHHERYEKTTSTQETRRGFIKIAAALAGTASAFLVHQKIQERLDSGEDRLEGEIGAAEQTAALGDQSAIQEYFGESLTQRTSRVRSVVASAENAVRSGKASQSVAASFNNVIATGKAYAENLESINASPDELAKLSYLSKCGAITEQLEAADTTDERIATMSALLEGLGIVGAMSLIVVPGRVMNLKYPGQKDLYPENHFHRDER